jgi:hypothetical protein
MNHLVDFMHRTPLEELRKDIRAPGEGTPKAKIGGKIQFGVSERRV